MSDFTIREAQAGDAPQLAALIALLGHEMTAEAIAERIGALGVQGIPQLVAADGDRVVGLCGLHRMTVVYRPKPVGRITILVVREDARGRGIGRALVAAAKDLLRNEGCGLLEITSNDRLTEAHEFYAHLGFDRTSKRFALKLD